MYRDQVRFDRQLDRKSIEKIKAELSALDAEMIDAEGIKLKPSQCYHFDTSPLHILFNTNCPDQLRQKVTEIISKHAGES